MDMAPKKDKFRRLPNGELFNLTTWKEARKRVMAMRDPYCAICHKWIDVTLPAFQPMACEVDHIIPIARGGAPYDIENMQMSHSSCNRKKGAKLRSDYDGMDGVNIAPLSNAW